MTSKLIILSSMISLLLVRPMLAAEFTYTEYAKAPDNWKRGFVLGIARYMTVVAQPNEEQPYRVRTAFQKCLGDTPDSVLVRHVEAYVTANPADSNGPMVAVVTKALFDFCHAEILKVTPHNTDPNRR